MENTKEQISTTDTLADFRDETIKENRTMFTNVIENVMKMPILPVNVGAVAENSEKILNMVEKRTLDNPTTRPKLAPLEDEL